MLSCCPMDVISKWKSTRRSGQSDNHQQKIGVFQSTLDCKNWSLHFFDIGAGMKCQHEQRTKPILVAFRQPGFTQQSGTQCRWTKDVCFLRVALPVDPSRVVIVYSRYFEHLGLSWQPEARHNTQVALWPLHRKHHHHQIMKVSKSKS